MAEVNLSSEQTQMLVDAFQHKVDDLEADLRYTRDRLNDTFTRMDDDRREMYRLNAYIRELENKLHPKVAAENFDWTTVEGFDKIPAIKAYREATGLGLKESKDAIEQALDAGKFQLRTPFQATVDPIIIMDPAPDLSIEVETDNPFLIDASK